MKNKTDNPAAVNRRGFLGQAGFALLSTSMLGSGLVALKSYGSSVLEEAEPIEIMDAPIAEGESALAVRKPVRLPPLNSRNPVAHSLADSLFWADIMMEHALFFVMLMPGDDIAAYRAQAQNHQNRFAQHLAFLRQTTFNRSNYRSINRRTIALVRPFLAFKNRMLDLQLRGRIHTLVWPLFFSHTAREADRFIKRLEMYNTGRVEFERAEVVDFWTSTMGEHAQFISQLLDPQETDLIQKADATADAFLGSLRRSPRNYRALLSAGEEIIDFKTAAERGIETGRIKSIIHPALADHVRREAIKYVDELKRS